MEFLLKLKPVLTTKQLERIANIFDNAGQVFLGAAVISPVITTLNKVDSIQPVVVVLGLIATIVCWLVSIKLTAIGEK